METPRSLMAMPVMTVQQAIDRRQAILELTKRVMVKNLHFGTMAGIDKPTLLKAGAEMLTTFFGLSPRFVCLEKVEDWTGADHDGEAFFFYRYSCELCTGGVLVGQGIGSCNSWERKYRYRKQAVTCPACAAEDIRRSRYPPRQARDAEPGWYCATCKADFLVDDPAIVDQPRGQVLNPNMPDVVNTIDKMAQKRALVGATLIAVNASDFFTQDLEDMDYLPEETPATPAPSPRSPGKATNGHKNGHRNETAAHGHWYENPQGKKQFDQFVDGLALNVDQILAALEVADILSFAGSLTDATKTIAEWVKAQSDRGAELGGK